MRDDLPGNCDRREAMNGTSLPPTHLLLAIANSFAYTICKL